MTYTDDNIDLYEDLWVRKRISELYGISNSQSECKKIFNTLKEKNLNSLDFSGELNLNLLIKLKNP